MGTDGTGQGQRKARPRLAISTGDPGGIGPHISVIAAARVSSEAQCFLFGPASVLSAASVQATCSVRVLTRDEFFAQDVALNEGEVGLVQTLAQDASQPWENRATARGGAAQLAALDAAIDAIAKRRCDRLVTAPVSKHAVTLAGRSFTGHTEYLAERAGLPADAVTMIFSGPRLCVSLATTHVAISNLRRQLTAARIRRAAQHLEEFLRTREQQSRALRLVMCGLNPHAGEGGLLGGEEAQMITPVVEELSRDSADCTWLGPIGAETAFRWAATGYVDGVVAQFHDQATIASKLLDWGAAVNVTWGLPYVRTSVDHGVAYDAAAERNADPSAMHAAIALALRLDVGAAIG